MGKTIRQIHNVAIVAQELIGASGQRSTSSAVSM